MNRNCGMISGTVIKVVLVYKVRKTAFLPHAPVCRSTSVRTRKAPTFVKHFGGHSAKNGKNLMFSFASFVRQPAYEVSTLTDQTLSNNVANP
jgi:hypothetical protein